MRWAGNNLRITAQLIEAATDAHLWADKYTGTLEDGEVFEFQSMYPQMIKDADEEGNKGAQRSFTFANEVEKVHADLYKKALEDIGKNKEVDYYVCQICGHTAENEPPDKCPVCGAGKKAYKKID